MNCAECGNPVEKDAQFCPKCFARIEPPGLWQKFISLFQGTTRPNRPLIKIKKTITIKTTDKDGQQHEYHSLDEVPPELRAEIQKAQAEALKETLRSSSSNGLVSEIIVKKTTSIFKVKDATGNEHTYHSLDEMPPEIRSAWEQAQRKIK